MNDQKFNIAIQYFNSGNFTLAEENLKEAINLDPENLKYQNFLSILFINKKQYNQAINILKKILEVDNNFLDALINLSNIYVDLEFPEKAVKYFEKACKLNPKNIDLLNNFGLNLLKLNKYNKAKSFFLKVLELDSKNTSALMNLGVINIDRNNSINKKLSFDYYKTGLIKKLNDNYIQAINYWKKTIDLDYSNYAAHFNLGSVYDKFGKIDLANESYTKAININPNYKKAIYNQALIYLKKANFSKGWPGYDLRENCLGTLKIYKSINIKKNQIWNGNPFNGTLVVHGEQGIGDEVLFSSILSELKKIMPKLIVTLDDRLIPMMKRSFPSISFFGDYYADLIYVVNTQSYSVHNIGVTYVVGRLGFSAATGPFISTDYNYIEEVRNSYDALEGYFQFKTSGDIPCNSYGIGLALNKRLHLGLSFNQLLETTLNSHINDNQNIINMFSSTTSYENFATFSIWTILTDEIEFSIGFEESARIEYTSLLDMTINQSTGYPEYDTSTIMLPAALYKPSYTRIGFTHTPKQVESHILTIEYEKAFYSDSEIDPIKLHDVHTISIGVEYKIYNFVPLRIGLTHRTSPFKSDLSKTIYSLGTGWNYKNITMDIGCRYWNIAYPYRDIFPVATDTSNPFGSDIVKENHIDISFSVLYKI